MAKRQKQNIYQNLLLNIHSQCAFGKLSFLCFEVKLIFDYALFNVNFIKFPGWWKDFIS